MAAYLDIAVCDAVLALHGGLGRDDALGEQCEGLGGLEGGAWGLGLADGLAHVAAMGRVGGQTEYLAIGRVDGHDGARLSLQQPLAQLLQRRAYGEWSVSRQCLGGGSEK